MLDDLTTEGRHPASEHIDSLSAREIAELMNREDAKVTAAVATQLDVIADAIEVIVERLREGGRLIYVGAGTSGRLGVLDASECPPTFNTPPELVVGLIAGGYGALTRSIEGAEDFPEYGVRDLQEISFSAQDVLVGIATSGRTPYVIGALQYGQQLGAATIGLACNRNSDLEPYCQLAIVPVVGPEIVSGSTRMKAGTATKQILNMLTTGTMIRLGKTYGNLMVDLRATNSKLRIRSVRIVSQITGLQREAASELLERCGGELKTAILVQLAGVSPEQARSRLQLAQGHLRTALERSLDSPPD